MKRQSLTQHGKTSPESLAPSQVAEVSGEEGVHEEPADEGQQGHGENQFLHRTLRLFVGN